MDILIVYATYSGATQQAAETIAATLKQQGHAPTVQSVMDTRPEDFEKYTAVILGSNSWYEQKEEGNMHSGFLKLEPTLSAGAFAHKKIFVYGLGDANMYTVTFTGGATKLQHMVENHGGSLVMEPLRINRFYFEREENEQKLVDWARTVASNLT